MVANIKGKKLIGNLVITLVCSLLFSLVIPLLFLFGLEYIIWFFSTFRLPMSDSILVKYEFGEVWKVFGGIVIVQSILTIPATISVCVAISFLTEKLRTGWVYLWGVFVSFAIFGVFQFISFVIANFIAEEAFVFFWYLFTTVIVILFSIVFGLILVIINKKLNK